MTNQPLLHCGDFALNQVAHVPVYVETTGGVPASGMVFTDFMFEVAKESESSTTCVTGTVTMREKGTGLYEFEIPAALMDEEGLFIYCASPAVPSALTTFRGCGRVIDPDEYRVCAVPGYLGSTGRLVYLVWLEKNGQRIATPTSAHLLLRKEAGSGAALVDADCGTPNADGVFTVVLTPLTVDSNTVYEVVATVVSGGETYVSCRGHSTYS